MGKHSQYQAIPSFLRPFLGNACFSAKPRFDRERLDFVLQFFNPKDKIVLDIGGNTGFFTFEMIHYGAQKVIYYEGNDTHVEFVQTALQLLNLRQTIEIRASYFPFDAIPKESYDFTFLFNVLHHVGADFNHQVKDREEAKKLIIRYLNNLSKITQVLAFQMGFCRKGDRNLPLFANGTKDEMIRFIVEGIQDFWTVMVIGIPEKHQQEIVYCPLNSQNIRRDDSLGEFLNRPLFMPRSKTMKRGDKLEMDQERTHL